MAVEEKFAYKTLEIRTDDKNAETNDALQHYFYHEVHQTIQLSKCFVQK